MTEYSEYKIYQAPEEKQGLRGAWDEYPNWKDAVEKTLDRLREMEGEGVWLRPKTKQELEQARPVIEKTVEDFKESLAPFMDEKFQNSSKEALRRAKEQAGPQISTFMWAEVAGPAFAKTEKLVKELAIRNGLNEATATEIAMEAADIAAWSITWPILELQRIDEPEFKKTLISHNPFDHLLSLYELGAARINFQLSEQGEKLAIDFLIQENGENRIEKLLF